ncbi:MAG: hypothetical protein AAF653_19530, partial [Chloroflexota bacterium]
MEFIACASLYGRRLTYVEHLLENILLISNDPDGAHCYSPRILIGGTPLEAYPFHLACKTATTARS